MAWMWLTLVYRSSVVNGKNGSAKGESSFPFSESELAMGH